MRFQLNDGDGCWIPLSIIMLAAVIFMYIIWMRSP